MNMNKLRRIDNYLKIFRINKACRNKDAIFILYFTLFYGYLFGILAIERKWRNQVSRSESFELSPI